MRWIRIPHKMNMLDLNLEWAKMYILPLKKLPKQKRRPIKTSWDDVEYATIRLKSKKCAP
jgi:hypothetical protein